MPGEIISEHRARSNRNAARHHRGFAGDFPRNPHARTFGARLHVLTVVREVEAILKAKTAPFGYDLITSDLEHRIAGLIRRAHASDLKPNILVTHGASIYAEILAVAEEAEADLVIVGSHRPAMKDYLLGTNAARVVRHARCSVLVARE